MSKTIQGAIFSTLLCSLCFNAFTALASTPADTAREAIIAAGDKALTVAPVSIMDKEQVPPSGDKHDYLSIAIYYWPNPDTPDGLPWVNHDGERYPAVDDIPDAGHKNTMERTVRDCALAYRLTGDERYAEHAAAQLKAWFLDPATRMNPNLAYAQGVPGMCDGRPWGIIDTAHLGEICDYAEMLTPSHHWNAADHEGLKCWFQDYLDWLRESPNGITEGLTLNNHAVWYDAQVVHYALFVGETDYAREVCEAAQQRLIAKQIAPDGRQPQELRRTKSWSYSIYNLEAFFQLAQLAECVGVDLWHYETADGRGLRGALEYLIPYAQNHESWPDEQITEFNPAGLAPLLAIAADAYGDARYAQLAVELGGERYSVEARALIPPSGMLLATSAKD